MHTYPKRHMLYFIISALLLVFMGIGCNSWATEVDNPDFLPMIKKNCTPNGEEQSPELYIVYYPDVLTSSSETTTFACSHGFPWEVDTRVPLILYGKGDQKRCKAKKSESRGYCTDFGTAFADKYP